MKLIDGKAIREYNLDKIQNEVTELKNRGITPALAVIIVGSDPASRVYVNNKKAACERVGMKSLEFALPEETTTEELLALIDNSYFAVFIRKVFNDESRYIMFINGIIAHCFLLSVHLTNNQLFHARFHGIDFIKFFCLFV